MTTPTITCYIEGQRVPQGIARYFAINKMALRGFDKETVAPFFDAACTPDGEEARDTLADWISDLEIMVG
jgi:hypothetical protein